MLCHIAGVTEGDEVITSTVSFVATANCFIFEGGRPVFADVDPETLNLDPAAVEAAIDRKSTRLNSSHTVISYAVFCLKKKRSTHPSDCSDSETASTIIVILSATIST